MTTSAHAAGVTSALFDDRYAGEPFDASTALADATRVLHAAWLQERDPQRRTALTAATTLAAHAAIDSLLHSWALRERPDLAAWRTGTTLSRAARFTAALGRSLPTHLGDLCQARHALGRDASTDERRRASPWIEGDGADRALRSLAEIEEALAPAH